MLDTATRRAWYVVAVVALVFAGLLGTAGMVAGIFISLVILTFRQYQSWRHLSSRRRAVGFGAGLLALILLIPASRFWGPLSDEGVLGHLRHLGGWSLASILVFWLASNFHLALRMRLHFLRLRPKLAVSAILIGVVPLVLVVLLGVVAFYAGLGGARATRATAILESWRQVAAAGGDLSVVGLDSAFVWTAADTQGAATADTTAVPSRPEWAVSLAGDLKNLVGDQDLDPSSPWYGVADTTAWFRDRERGRLWLLDWRGLDGPDPVVRGWQLGDAGLEHLSGLLSAEVRIVGNQTSEADTLDAFADSEDGRLLPFGGAVMRVIYVDDPGSDNDGVLVHLLVTLAELRADFFSGENNLNKAIVVGLVVLAVLLLFIELFAVYFGVRISEGIVAGVHALHRGTQALAGGDLDTVIDIPNEDEFGDVAESFNEMTMAVKKGREDALARERLTRELDTARQIQERLLPAAEPDLPGFEVSGTSVPSREVGGDYFDFLLQGDDRIGVAIGDVSGKGMPAALLMSNLQASLHGQVIHPSTVAEVVGRVNNLIVKSTDPHMFATFFYGLLDLRNAVLTSTNAGHNPPLVVRADGQIEELTDGGLILGILEDQDYQQQSVELAPGDVVVMYTDGITEAVGPSAVEDDPEAMFGDEALREVVLRSRTLPAVGIKDAILAAVRDHTAGVAQSDDITLVVVRRKD